MSQDGKVAVVTGAALGIGRAIALQLADDGADIAIWDINIAGAQETADLIQAKGKRSVVYEANVASAAAIANAADKTHKEFGPVSILINNAALTGSSCFEDLTEEMWDAMIAVDLKGPFLCIKAVLPDMVEAGWGRVVNITSSAMQRGGPHMAHYVAAKSGLLGLTKSLASEYAARGVTFNNVPPFYVETPPMRVSQQKHVGGGTTWEESIAKMPMKRAGKPEDIAKAVSYLASDGAGYVTGHTLSVNGGIYMV